MRIVSRNCRGCSKDGFLSRVLFYIKLLNMDVFCLLIYTRLDPTATENFLPELPFDNAAFVPALGLCGGIILFWNSSKFNINVYQA